MCKAHYASEKTSEPQAVVDDDGDDDADREAFFFFFFLSGTRTGLLVSCM